MRGVIAVALGLAAICAGVAFIYWPAAVILAGLMLVVTGCGWLLGGADGEDSPRARA